MVYLIGYMGVGKTTLAKLLAEQLHLPFYDTDKEIEKKEKRSEKQKEHKRQLLLKQWHSRLKTGYSPLTDNLALSLSGAVIWSV